MLKPGIKFPGQGGNPKGGDGLEHGENAKKKKGRQIKGKDGRLTKGVGVPPTCHFSHNKNKGELSGAKKLRGGKRVLKRTEGKKKKMSLGTMGKEGYTQQQRKKTKSRTLEGVLSCGLRNVQNRGRFSLGPRTKVLDRWTGGDNKKNTLG